jgi:predicted metal-dependent peptidase
MIAKIKKATAQIMTRDPFFARLLMGKLRVDESIPTFATDMKHIFYNPKFSEGMTLDENKGVIIHEVLHIAYRHGFRKGSRNHNRWNIACDYAINLVVIEAGYVLPKEALLDQQYKGMSAEQIYNLIEDEPEGYEPDLMEVEMNE